MSNIEKNATIRKNRRQFRTNWLAVTNYNRGAKRTK